MTPLPPSGTVTLLISDIEGSTRLWEERPDAMTIALERHDDLMRSAIEGAGGYVFKTVGDSFCAAFTTATDAASAAADAQQALRAQMRPESIELRVRMALHTGICEERDGDYFGPTVNRVTRLGSVAHGGQVLVSGTTADLLNDAPQQTVALRDLGVHRLKDLTRPEHVFQLDIVGIEEDFPPLRSLDPLRARNNLPAQLTSFVGRDTEIADVRSLLEESRLITLTGAGGSGKSRLALQVAAESLEAYEDGVWLVELAPVNDPDLVPGLLASVLDIRTNVESTTTESLAAALAERHLVIVLDNCEHLVGSCATLVEALLKACPGVRVLTTSREALGLTAEHVFRVPALSLPDATAATLGFDDAITSDAVQLFCERAKRHRQSFILDAANVGDVISLVRHLDGIPLAIELASARLRTLSVTELVDRLDDHLRLLTGGSRTALPRQRTMRALIEWSYDLLSEGERHLLCRLSVFVGGFSLAAAEAIGADNESVADDETIDLLESLVDKSLVEATPSTSGIRFRVLETIRQFAQERLAAHGPEVVTAARDDHARWFLTLGEEAEPHFRGHGQSEWLVRLEAEHDNLHQAMVHLTSDPTSVSDALRLGVAISFFWKFQGYLEEGSELLHRALAVADSSVSPALRARALLACTPLTIKSREQSALVEEGLGIARTLNDDGLLSGFLRLRAQTGALTGNASSARLDGDESIAHARADGDPHLLAMALSSAVSRVVFATGPDDPEIAYARACSEEALGLFRVLGDHYLEVSVLNDLAVGAQFRDPGEARRYLELAVDRLDTQPLLNQALRTHIDSNLVEMYLGEGDVEAALRTLRRCVTYANPSDGAHQLFCVAVLAYAHDDAAHAACLLGATECHELRLGLTPIPFEIRQRGSLRGGLLGLMGEPAFDEAYRSGHDLLFGDAFVLARAVAASLSGAVDPDGRDRVRAMWNAGASGRD
jgi:predicted ATPase/class 3 adenylate cyclase